MQLFRAQRAAPIAVMTNTITVPDLLTLPQFILMIKNSLLHVVGFLLLAITLFQSAPLAQASDRNVMIVLPAETVLHTLQKALPIPIPMDNSEMSGQVLVTDLRNLTINGNTISVEGTLEGNNLSVLTAIAGQQIKLKLGQVKLPLTCNLATRVDTKSRTLFVTPNFPANTGNNDPSSLQPLLQSVSGKEFAVPLDAYSYFTMNFGDKQIPLGMLLDDMIGKDNALELQLRPDVAMQK